MLCRRKFLLATIGAPAAAISVAAPFELTISGPIPSLETQAARAQGKGGGQGGGGNGNGSSGAGGNGNSGAGDGGNSNNGGDSSAPNSSNSDNSSAGKGGEDGGGSRGQSESIDGSTIEVHHSNGMREMVGNGHYVMTDAQGRTIVNRAATPSDRARLQGMIK